MKQILSVIAVVAFVMLNTVNAQTIRPLTVDDLEQRIDGPGDTLYVINFWATWCPPCVEELPLFDGANLSSFYSPIKIVLVSLDFKNQIDSRLIPFVQKKAITEEVAWLNESNPNEYVNRINSSWSGAIPATLFSLNGASVFHEGELDYSKLTEIVKSFSKP